MTREKKTGGEKEGKKREKERERGERREKEKKEKRRITKERGERSELKKRKNSCEPFKSIARSKIQLRNKSALWDFAMGKRPRVNPFDIKF
ncbi:hypothetical protein GBA52_008961 [Prunus armeniaca]|nr:hypothetical protein GBA52_008961 [Prunus armeniaca]